MAETAFQTQYRQQHIRGFEQTASLLRQTVTHEATFKGNQATFLVADSGDAEAQTRGVNGLIPGRPDNNTQLTATLKEWHDKPIKTGFNIFASQGDQNAIMQENSNAVINRKIDSDILSALSSATQRVSATAQKATLNMVVHATTILGNNKVPMDGNISAAITPAFHAYLMQVKEFASVDYINDKPFENKPIMFRWFGVNWIVHNNLTGAGTASETCYFYHKSAIGHATNVDDMDSVVGYNKEHDYSFNRVSIFMGGKLLQNTGVVKVLHDGSEFAAV